jgi:hypothetical protein
MWFFKDMKSEIKKGGGANINRFNRIDMRKKDKFIQPFGIPKDDSLRGIGQCKDQGSLSINNKFLTIIILYIIRLG